MKKIYLLLIVSLLFIQLTSAGLLDISKEQPTLKEDLISKGIEISESANKYPSVKISTWLDAPLISKDILDTSLTQHDESCGEYCSSQGYTKLYEDGVLFEGFEFWTILEDGTRIKQPIRSYQVYIRTGEEEYTEDVFEYQCSPTGKININGTADESCSNVKTETITKTKPLWEEYQIGDEVKAGEYEWKLEGQKKPSRTVDFIPIVEGNNKISEWAVWGSGWTYNDLTVYDNFNDASINTSKWTTTLFGTGTITESGGDLYINGGNIGTGFETRITSTSNLTNFTVMQINFNNLFSNGQNAIIKYGGQTITAGPLNANSGIFNMTLEKINSTSYSVNCTTGNGNFDCASYITPTSTDLIFQSSNGHINVTEVRYLETSSITLNSPSDDYISLTNEVDFNCSASVTGGATLTNMSLWLNGVLNETESYFPTNLTNTTTYSSPLDSSDRCVSTSTYNINTLAWNTTSEGNCGGGGSTSCNFRTQYTYIDDSVANSSIQGLSSNSGWVTLNVMSNPNPTKVVKKIEYIGCIVADGNTQFQVRNVNITINNNYGTSVITDTITETTNWTCQACDSDGDCGFASENRSLSIDTVAPTLIVNYGNGTFNYGSLTSNHTVNYTITDSNLDSCWIEYNGANTTIDCESGIQNTTNFALESGVYTATLYANDSVNNIGSNTFNWSYKVFENSRTNNATAYETGKESYSINVTANTSLTGVNLLFNSTEYAMSQSGTIWSYSRDLPSSVVGNNSIQYEFTYAGDTFNSYTSYQNVEEIYFGICNGTYTTNYLNITFKDEADLTSINASIPTSTFEYYLGTGTETKEYNYINSSDNSNYEFCASPIDRTFNVDPYIQYKQGSSYPQRIYDPDYISYSNATTNKTLYLLSSADGIYVTFQVVNSGDQVISGVEATATREINGEDVIVGTGTTSASGTVTFWLNPDFIHTFSFSKTGYETYSYSDIPTQTSYTIYLEGGTGSTTYDFHRGIIYSILPTDSSLYNDTTYSFEFNLTSSYWDADSYGFSLRLANGSVVGSDSETAEGTPTIVSYNVNNQSIIYMDYYWIVDGNSTTGTKYWIIQNTEYTSWSIATIFTDFDLYLESGIFGLDNFGRMLIIFMIIFISAGIVSYKFGLTSPLAVSTIIFGIIFFFDIAVGIIPEIRGIEHLLTYISALALALLIFNEVQR